MVGKRSSHRRYPPVCDAVMVTTPQSQTEVRLAKEKPRLLLGWQFSWRVTARARPDPLIPLTPGVFPFASQHEHRAVRVCSWRLPYSRPSTSFSLPRALTSKRSTRKGTALGSFARHREREREKSPPVRSRVYKRNTHGRRRRSSVRSPE